MMRLLTVIVERQKGSKFMDKISEMGGKHITCIYGQGSFNDELLEMLKINKINKEVVRALIDEKDADNILDKLEEKLYKHNTGVAFTTNFVGEKEEDVEYEALYVIVDKEEGDKVIELGQKNGAKGATIMHGRGSGIQKKSIFLNMTIEPEKDIVLMLVKKEIAERIKDAIYQEMNLEEEAKGIMFSLPVSDVRGLVEQKQ
jgi:nitrogen regulatory protein PII